jgi:hypothetical protein
MFTVSIDDHGHIEPYHVLAKQATALRIAGQVMQETAARVIVQDTDHRVIFDSDEVPA